MSEIIRFDWGAVEQLLPIVEEFVAQRQAGEKIDLLGAASQVVEAFGIEDLGAFATDNAYNAMEDGLGVAFEGDDVAAIASIFADICVPVTEQIVGYVQGDMSASSLIHGLESIRTANVGEIQGALQNMLGVPDAAADALADKFGAQAVSVYCFYATYKIYENAARDAELAKERRMEAEQLCGQAVARLKSERAEMEDKVSSYMLGHLLPFGEGVAAMDAAIMENDDEGFIQANTELWEVFGRTSQYSSAEEFDKLMLSDETFKL